MARGYCPKLPEDKRVNVEQLLWSFCCYPRDKGAGTGCPVQAGSRPATPEHLPQTSFLPVPPAKPPQGLPKIIWPRKEVWRSTPEAETLLCSKPRHPPVLAQGTSAMVCRSPFAFRKSLRSWERGLKSSIQGHSTLWVPTAGLAFSTSSQSVSWHQAQPQKSRAISQHCSCQCLFQCLQPIYLRTALPLTLAVSVCGFSNILMFWFPADDVSMMAWFYFLNK